MTAMTEHTLYLLALDPTHIGAGGYRLGRVDNSILRDAATGLPKIPGSSLAGAVRSGALYRLPDAERDKGIRYARSDRDEKNRARPHPGEEDPVARIFGYAEGDEAGKSRIGVVTFHDAEVFAFPVPTMSGPRWVTTRALLEAAGLTDVPEVAIGKVHIGKAAPGGERLNLGWLLLDVEKGDIPFPDGLAGGEFEHLRRNLVLVHEDLFPALVNSNLETRTSVSIDFETGAAAEGLLFTYEAAPRGTLYRTTVGFDGSRFPKYYDEARARVRDGLELACQLGLGAMTTRGFGRMRAHWLGGI